MSESEQENKNDGQFASSARVCALEGFERTNNLNSNVFLQVLKILLDEFLKIVHNFLSNHFSISKKLDNLIDYFDSLFIAIKLVFFNESVSSEDRKVIKQRETVQESVGNRQEMTATFRSACKSNRVAFSVCSH